MARIRTVKPEFWANEKMAKVSRDARLLALALLNNAEDHGVARANPAYLRGQAFPYDEDMTTERVGKLVVELEGVDYLRRFGYDGQAYLFIVGFPKHQRIDKPSKASFPQPPENILHEPSASPPRALAEPSSLERKGKEEEGKGSGKEAPPPAKPFRGSPVKVERPKRPEEDWLGQDFRQWAQFKRQEAGLVPEEATVSIHDLEEWWGVVRQAIGPDAKPIKRAFVAFGDDKHWQVAKPPLPFRAFMSQWRKYLPQLEAQHAHG